MVKLAVKCGGDRPCLMRFRINGISDNRCNFPIFEPTFEYAGRQSLIGKCNPQYAIRHADRDATGKRWKETENVPGESAEAGGVGNAQCCVEEVESKALKGDEVLNEASKTTRIGEVLRNTDL